jgi:hypothetical protein
LSINAFLDAIHEHDINYELDSIKRLFQKFLQDNLDIYFDIGIDNNKVYLVKKDTIPDSTILAKCPYLMEICGIYSLELSMSYHSELMCDVLMIN